MPISDTVLGILIGTGISTLIAPMILALFNRLLNRKKDEIESGETALNLAREAVADLAREKEANKGLLARIAALEQSRQGPYRLTVDFYTLPLPLISESELKLLKNKDVDVDV